MTAIEQKARTEPRRGARRGVLAAMLALMIGAAMAEPGQPAPGPLAESLAQEACRGAPREDLAPVPGLPPELQVWCAERLAGAIVATRFAARSQVQGESALFDAYQGSREAAALQQRVQCGDPQALQFAPDLAALPCRLSDGGWPHLVVLGGVEYSGQRVLLIAEGPPALLPALVSAMRPGEALAGLAPSDYVAALQDVFGGAVPLASAAEMAAAQGLVQDARTANSQGRYRDAEALFRQALELQTRLLAPSDIAMAETLLDLALNVSNQGRDEEALALFRRAEPVIQVSPNIGDRARFAAYQGYHAANFRRYDDALAFAGGSVGLWRQVVAGPSLNFSMLGERDPAEDPQLAEKGELALALDLQANMALRMELPGLAEAAATEALQILNTAQGGLPRWWKANVLLTLGKVSAANGRLSAAERYLNAALAEQRLVAGDGPQTLRILAALAQAYQREGMNTSAIVTYREMFGLIRSLPPVPEGLISTEDLVPFGLAITAYADALSDEGQRQGLYAEAFDAFQLIRPSVVEQTVARAAARLAVAEPGLASLVDAMHRAERARDVANLALSFETSLPDNQRSRIAEDRLGEARRRAVADLADVQAQLARDYPQYQGLAAPAPLDLLGLRQRLAAGEAVVSFLVGEQASFVQLVRREGVWVARVPAGMDALSESVASLRRALDFQGGSINEFDLRLAHRLYQQLLGPVAEGLTEIDHLVVVPAGPLASLPFALLVASPPGTDAGYEQAAWLAGRMAISHVPSLHSFFTLRTTAASTTPSQGLLALGDPVLTGSRAAGARGVADAAGASAGAGRSGGLSALATSCRTEGPAPAELLRALAPLPDTADELRSVGRIFSAAGQPARVLLRGEATEAQLRAQTLEDYRVLYFATHGLLPGELKCQAEPGLVLTPPTDAAHGRDHDGLLEASEIAALRLNADLVVLSACNTAGSGGRFGGDALSGLAEAFFHAGARGLLVSHWQVPSAATASLMTGLFEVLGPDLDAGAAAALQAAQRQMMRRPDTAHPFFWAAFVMVGDGLAEDRLPLSRGGRP